MLLLGGGGGELGLGAVAVGMGDAVDFRAGLAAADEALATRLKERLKGAMETTGKLKIDTTRFRLSVAGNGGKQPLEINTNYMDAWAPPFRSTIVEPNREAIRIALETVAPLPAMGASWLKL